VHDGGLLAKWQNAWNYPTRAITEGCCSWLTQISSANWVDIIEVAIQGLAKRPHKEVRLQEDPAIIWGGVTTETQKAHNSA
jgi:hypothetical protein